MALRSGTQGYGWVTKTLHWLVFAAIAAQFLVGYSLGRIDVPERDCDPPGESLSGGETTAAEEERLDRTEDRCEAAADRAEERADDPVGTAWDDLTSGTIGDGGIGLGEAHVLLGLLILTLAVVRVAWRRHDGLPPWSEHLSDGDRRLVHWTERVLLTLLFVVPLSGSAARGDRRRECATAPHHRAHRVLRLPCRAPVHEPPPADPHPHALRPSRRANSPVSYACSA